MPDIYLYTGDATPSNVVLRDPTYPAGVTSYIKKIAGVAYSSIKKVAGVVMAQAKKVAGLS